MPDISVVIQNPRDGNEIVTIRADGTEEAIAHASRQGYHVDRAQTMELQEFERDHPGRAAANIGVVLGLLGWAGLPIAVGAVVLGTIAMERSRGRRGVTAIVLGFLSGLFSASIVWSNR